MSNEEKSASPMVQEGLREAAEEVRDTLGYIFECCDDHHTAMKAEAAWRKLDAALSATPAPPVDETDRLAALEDLATLPDDLASLVAAHIREMYPAVAKSAPSTFILSVRNTVRNKAHGVIQPVLAALADRTQEREVRRG